MDRLEAAKFAPWITCMVQSVPSNANLVTSCWVRPKELVKKIWRAPLASGLEMIQCVNVSYISHDIIYVLMFAGCWLFPWESEIAKYKDQFRGWNRRDFQILLVAIFSFLPDLLLVVVVHYHHQQYEQYINDNFTHRHHRSSSSSTECHSYYFFLSLGTVHTLTAKNFLIVTFLIDTFSVKKL